MKHKIIKKIEFCYGHRLIGHKGKCRYLHGHNALIEVDIRADELDRNGMVIDFGDVRDIVKGWVDANLDHRMLLCRRDEAVSVLKSLKEPVYLMDDNPSAENIAKHLFYEIRKMGLDVCEVRLWETPSSCGIYHE
jgi:6-pyruvoyltetrahydropterin/6-carboxytetrahydropterin synthase